jgi:hypothetical protein
MSAHTPGPWQWDGDYTLRPVNPDPERSALHTIISPDGPFGFVQTATADVFPEFEADKLLIAAAPELLEALRTTRGNVASLGPAGAIPFEYREWLAMLDAAIAKATGAASC